MYQVLTKIISSSVFFSFLYLKLVNDVIEIIDRVATTPLESNQQASSVISDAELIVPIKIRAHALRVSKWNGNMDKLSGKS